LVPPGHPPPLDIDCPSRLALSCLIAPWVGSPLCGRPFCFRSNGFFNSLPHNNKRALQTGQPFIIYSIFIEITAFSSVQASFPPQAESTCPPNSKQERASNSPPRLPCPYLNAGPAPLGPGDQNPDPADEIVGRTTTARVKGTDFYPYERFPEGRRKEALCLAAAPGRRAPAFRDRLWDDAPGCQNVPPSPNPQCPKRQSAKL